ncbi:MAG: hypothetical protein ACE5E7_02510 [Anaerolineae bacterium]
MSQKKQPQQSQQEEKKSSEREREQGQAEWALGLGPAVSADSLDELPDHATARRHRQAAALQMQRRQGNQFVQRYLADSRNVNDFAPVDAVPSLPEVQREVKAGAGVEMTAQSIKFALNVTAKTDLPSPKFVDIELSFPVGVAVELKSKQERPYNIGGEKSASGDQALKASVEIYKNEAKKAAPSKLAELAANDIKDNGWEIDKVEWETSLGMGQDEETGGDKASVATGVKFTFKNGQESVVSVSAFEKVAGVGMKGPKFSMEHTVKLASAKLWENKDAELVVGGDFKVNLEVSPDWTDIMIELAKKGGRQVAREFARSALRGMVSFWLGAGGLIVGGVITVAATAADLARAREIREIIQAAQKAVDSYCRGYCVSWGITDFGFTGSEQWYNEGKTAGSGKLQQMITEIQQHPVFAPWNFTDAELRGALRAQLKQHGAEVWRQVEGEIQMKIYQEFVIQFYNKRKAGFFTPEYMARKDAQHVARVLGVDEGVIPKAE